MAVMLREGNSTDKHLNATSRHIRLCRRAGAEVLIEAILPPYETLISTQKATEAAAENREAAHDAVLFLDTDLDNGVRNSFDDCKRYDRDNPGGGALSRAFPDGRFTPIINITPTKEPDAVEALAQRFESFGESHPLYQTAAVLREKVTASRNQIDAYKAQIKAEKQAEEEEQIAKFELRRQYEHNYLEARKLYGRSMANSLFPRLGGSRKLTVDDEEPPTDTE